MYRRDANAAGLGEMWLGAGRQVQDLAIFTLGTGVGGGLLFNGKIWRGMAGMAGEFGHIIIDPEGVPCTCGGRGCLEQYASAKAIMRMASEAIDSAAASELSRAAAASGPGFGAKTVYELAMRGDEQSHKIFQHVGRSLGIALASLVNALNLPLHIIGGGVAASWDAFAPCLFEELQRRSMVYAATAPSAISASEGSPADASMKTIVTRAQLGSDAGLFGAARLPMLLD